MAELSSNFDPHAIPPRSSYDALPDIPAIQTLKSRRQWVAWNYEDQGGPKPTKPLFNPRTGFKASHSNPDHWSSYNDAVTRVIRSGLEGVGYVLSEDDNLTGGDMDGCRDAETVQLDAWAAEIIALAETYAEVSPSGQGVRLFWLGKVPSAIKCNPAGVEIYGSKRYMTITRGHIPRDPIETRA